MIKLTITVEDTENREDSTDVSSQTYFLDDKHDVKDHYDCKIVRDLLDSFEE